MAVLSPLPLLLPIPPPLLPPLSPYLDLQVGEGVQEGGGCHGDLVGDVVEGVHRAAVHGRRVGEVRGRGQEVSCTRSQRSRGSEVRRVRIPLADTVIQSKGFELVTF